MEQGLVFLRTEKVTDSIVLYLFFFEDLDVDIENFDVGEV